MPARICRHPGCGRTTRERYCDEHTASDAGELGSTARGYDSRWQRLREAFVRDWLATRGPYCGECGCLLRPGKETHVDHIVPFDGMDDPMRLEWSNLQVLCRECNAKKARKQGGG
jgi:5-methylcytosine-specific restriction enzyme A